MLEVPSPDNPHLPLPFSRRATFSSLSSSCSIPRALFLSLSVYLSVSLYLSPTFSPIPFYLLSSPCSLFILLPHASLHLPSASFFHRSHRHPHRSSLQLLSRALASILLFCLYICAHRVTRDRRISFFADSSVDVLSRFFWRKSVELLNF